MNNILLFAGTTEGRKIAEHLGGSDADVYVCVATEYGKELVKEESNIHVLAGRLTQEEMEALTKEKEIQTVIDATHPFAVQVSENIKKMCEHNHIVYLRALREEQGKAKEAVYVKDIQEAAAYLKQTDGKILITTGSKELTPYLELPGFQERCYVRVLSTLEAVQACTSLGLEGEHLIAMQGPFSYEINLALLTHIGASYLVTKESGAAGGFMEKIQAAQAAGVTPIVIGRKKEEGLSLDALYEYLETERHISRKRSIVVVGIGPGSEQCMTEEVKAKVEQADLLIGAPRMVASVKKGSQQVYEEYRAEKIKDYLNVHSKYAHVVVVLSGDVGFHSGAKRLLEVLEPDFRVSVFPGVSSVSYLAARLHVSYENTPLLSIHGTNSNPIDYARQFGTVFLLVSNQVEIHTFLTELCDFGYKDASVTVGARLSYEEESIITGTAEELRTKEFDSLSVIYVSLKEHTPYYHTGISDACFCRGTVPMTKQDVRAVILSRLQLKKDAVVYDIGAGTGSVSVEAAMTAIDGKVYAVEKNAEGIQLIRQNQKKFHVSNIIPVAGEAPDVLDGLPIPTHVFIGGSGHHLCSIIEQLKQKNNSVRIVISAITLNTVSQCMTYLETHPDIKPEIVQIQAAEARQAGTYQMMAGQNPIYIFAF